MKSVLVTLVAAIALVVSTSNAGSRYGRVEAYCSYTYTAYFYGGQVNSVQVSGDGDTDLDLYVYDEYGYLVAEDEGWGDECYVSWYQRWGGTYTIKIVNRGGVYNRYWIGTN
jgi:hypothetical protein